MSRKEKIVLSIGILALLLMFCGVVGILGLREVGKEFWDSFDDFDVNEQPWTECPIALPDKAGRIVFLRRHNHPFLAEYDRKIRYETGTHVAMKLLPPNTGGKTKINVYYYSAKDGQGPFVRLRDQYGNYRFDLSNDANEIRAIPQSLTREYIGRLDGVQEPLRFVSVQESPEERIKLK